LVYRASRYFACLIYFYQLALKGPSAILYHDVLHTLYSASTIDANITNNLGSSGGKMFFVKSEMVSL
jgi:hypothetical protein